MICSRVKPAASNAATASDGTTIRFDQRPTPASRPSPIQERRETTRPSRNAPAMRADCDRASTPIASATSVKQLEAILAAAKNGGETK